MVSTSFKDNLREQSPQNTPSPETKGVVSHINGVVSHIKSALQHVIPFCKMAAKVAVVFLVAFNQGQASPTVSVVTRPSVGLNQLAVSPPPSSLTNHTFSFPMYLDVATHTTQVASGFFSPEKNPSWLEKFGSLPENMPAKERKAPLAKMYQHFDTWLSKEMKRVDANYKAAKNKQEQAQLKQDLQILNVMRSCMQKKEMQEEISRTGENDSAHPENEPLIHFGHVMQEIESILKQNPPLKKQQFELMLLSLLHDSFKYAARELSKKEGKKTDHGVFAARFLKNHIDSIEDKKTKERLLKITEFHDMGFYAYQDYHKKGATKEEQAKALTTLKNKVSQLIDCQGLELFNHFYIADSRSGIKDAHVKEWADKQIKKLEKEILQEKEMLKARAK